jgi:hypothetical protein
VEPVGAAGKDAEVGVGCFDSGVGQAVLEGVVDRGQVFLDGLGEADELCDLGSFSPGEPAGE